MEICVHLNCLMGAELLKIGYQNDILMLWYSKKVDNEATEKRTFRIMGTGHQIDAIDGVNYIDTVFQDGFVWHIFEIEAVIT